MNSNKLNLNKNKDKLLNTLTLKFTNKKLEKNYENTNNLGIKQNNKSLSLLSLIVAGLTVIVLITSNYIETLYTKSNNLLIEHLTNTTLIEEIKSNISYISSDFLFYGNYILINLTLLQTGNFTKEECLLSPKIQEYTNYVNFAGLYDFRILILVLISIFYPFCFFLSFILKKIIYQKILFCFITFFFSHTFQIIGRVLIQIPQFPLEGIFIYLVIQVLIKVIISNQYITDWLLFSLGTSLSIIFIGLIILFFIPRNIVLSYYLIANTLAQTICILISYLNEKKFRNLYFLKSNIDVERTYLVDLLYKMDQGFISYNKKLLFLNDSMKKILSIFINENPKDFWEDSEKLNLSPLKGIEGKNENDLNYISQEENNNSVRFLRSNVRPDCKNLINKLLTYLTEFNINLPEKLISLFETKNENKNKNENYFDTFYNIVSENENFFNFTFLGNINIPSNSKVSNKKFQIMFRVKSCDTNTNDNYVEFMLIDVSEVVQNERERTVIATRSIYLFKIAHEFRNPISSIIELACGILDETNQNPKEISQVIRVSHETDIKVIEHKANYIDKLCKVMSQFLNDYTLITNLKFACLENCQLIINNLIICTECGFKTFCKKCKICEICVLKNDTNFDIMEGVKNINELFRELALLERANKPIIFKEIMEIETNFKNNSIHIRADEKLLNSAIYNIIFNSYKTSISINAEIRVLINQKYSINKECVITRIDIINNSIEINQNFINFLNSDEEFLYEKKCVCFELDKGLNNVENNDIFNNNYEIYVAFCMLKKLGSVLNIYSNQLGSIFSFTIINKIKDLNIDEYNNEAILNTFNKHFSCCVSSSPEGNFYESNSELDNTILNDKSFLFSYNENFIKLNSSKNVIERIKLKHRNSVTSIELKSSNNNLSLDYNKGNISVSNHSSSNEFISLEINKSLKKKQLDDVNNVTIINRDIRVLIIDDESMVRASIKRHLINITKSEDNASFETEEASNCYEAIEILYMSLIQNSYFDIIVIDEYMPNMRGSTLTKLLKGLNKENNFYYMTIISNTAFDTDEMKKFILDNGADFIMSKPVQFKEFKKIILGIIS